MRDVGGTLFSKQRRLRALSKQEISRELFDEDDDGFKSR